MAALNPAEAPPRLRLPEWLRIRLPTTESFARTRSLLDELKLHMVCESVRCLNHFECWSKGTATFMIAGDRCTRACGFCAVTTAKPLALEVDEPQRVLRRAFRRRQRQDHRQVFLGGEKHAVDEKLFVVLRWSGEDAGVGDLVHSTRETAHDEAPWRK